MQAIQRCEVKEKILEEIRLEAISDDDVASSDSTARNVTQKKGSLSPAISTQVKEAYLILDSFATSLVFG